jgi:adenylate cyclase class IV
MGSDSGPNAFIEIEHKFVVGRDFDQAKFAKNISGLAPSRQAAIKVRDTYFVLSHDRRHVFRHRFDHELQQLTVKSVEGDAAVRMEVNIPIDQSTGDQRPAVTEFMKALGCAWSGELSKDIQVAYFPDCEIVFYRAVNRDKVICCVEFEAVNPQSVAEGLSVVARYESLLGFKAEEREPRSLFELLLLDGAPSDVKALFI